MLLPFAKVTLLGATILSTTIVCASESNPNHGRMARSLVEKRALPSNLGLSQKNLKHGNVYIGFLPGFGEPKGPNNMTQINAKLPKPLSMMGIYIQLSTSDPNFAQMDAKVDELLQQKALFGGDIPALNIAIGPVAGFASVTTAVAKRLGAKMAAINQRGITVHLRYAWEMNGDWYAWGQQPAAFIKSWKLVTNAVRAAGATKTFMLWSPNSPYSTDGAVKGGLTPYWPGASYVDLVGMSFYSYGGQNRENIAPSPTFLSDTLTRLDRLYGSKQKKYMVLSETAAAYTINLDTGKPNTGGDSELKIKTAWLNQLLSSSLQNKFPYFKGFLWFEIVKDENAAGNTPVRHEDFRCILSDNSEVNAKTIALLGKGQ